MFQRYRTPLAWSRGLPLKLWVCCVDFFLMLPISSDDLECCRMFRQKQTALHSCPPIVRTSHAGRHNAHLSDCDKALTTYGMLTLPTRVCHCFQRRFIAHLSLFKSRQVYLSKMLRTMLIPQFFILSIGQMFCFIQDYLSCACVKSTMVRTCRFLADLVNALYLEYSRSSRVVRLSHTNLHPLP